ncbi:exo-alpha-sialidase [Olivibacter sp. SDN3]|uniref:sialidase family protein n=1 Tax=Olivibacter sp. SDN3 TaxID=2764720 RepID=UPI001650F609|nr:sialidase family protein [Olivibacter sp. SDN3]QNL51684.1 exo-alpha-sialidase [Olivibacter sp. SDN3]
MKPVIFFLLTLLASDIFAQPVLQQESFQIPILIGKKNNPVLRLEVELPDAVHELLSFELAGQVGLMQKEVKAWRVYLDTSAAKRHNLADIGHLQLLAEMPGDGMTLASPERVSLHKGKHVFWLSAELKGNANLEGSLTVSCKLMNIGNRKVNANSVSPNTQRFGVLVKQPDSMAKSYRIPGLATTKDGSLLAIYDVRYDSPRDLQGDMDIGVSRSTDGGRTWERSRIAIDQGEWGGLPQKFNGVSDACILVDKYSGTIYIAGLWMHGVIDDQGNWVEGLTDTSSVWNHQWRTKGSQPGLNVKQTSQFLLVKSTDDGKTWDKPVNLTAMCKKPAWWLWAPAPGQGITLQNGTLVFPSQGRNAKGEAFSSITYSIDGGKTWKTSTPATTKSTTECAVVELSDASLMLNMRANSNRGDTSSSNGRAVAVTVDLGETWQVHPSNHGALPEPTCMGSLHKHDDILLFSNPNNKLKREDITIKASLDEGMSWPEERQLLIDEWNGRGYSCLTSIDREHIGILYESSQADLVFQRFPVTDFIP